MVGSSTVRTLHKKQVLEKIADLRSIDNQIKSLSEEVPRQIPSERPTLSKKKEKIGSLCGRDKYCQNPPQETSFGEIPGKVSEDKKAMSHPELKKHETNPMTPPQTRSREKVRYNCWIN